MVPRKHDQIKVCDSMQGLWMVPDSIDEDDDDWETDDKQLKTTYLGKHKIRARNLIGTSHGDEELHVFYNDFSFIDFEESYVKKGGAFGTKTPYLFREKVGGEDEEE